MTTVLGPGRGWVVLTATVGRDLTPRRYRSDGERVAWRIDLHNGRFTARLLTGVSFHVHDDDVIGWALLDVDGIRPLWSQLLDPRPRRGEHVHLSPHGERTP